MASRDNGVGDALRRIRRGHRLSLRHVAEQVGVSVATLSRVETNKQSVDVALLLALAGALRVDVGEILDHHHEPPGRGEPMPLAASVDGILATLD
jgi:transcriptional regulator with XRE-family HTH domain